MPATPLPVSANVASLLASSNFAGFRSTLGLSSAALVATSTLQPSDANLTSWAAITRASGFDTFIAIPSSANLRALVLDESGTGALLFAGGALGAATATSLSVPVLFGTSNAIDIRSGASSQSIAIYQTYTSGSDYSRLLINNVGGYFQIKEENAGTGGAAGLVLGSQTLPLYLDGNSVITRGGSVTMDGTLAVTGASIFGAQVRLKGYTVATLPAGTQGDTAFVTDALTPTFLTILVGGGAVVTKAFYNGTNWIAQ